MKNKDNSEKKKITFGMGLLLYVMIMVLVGYTLIIVLWKYAEQYERTLPTDYMDSYVEGLDMDYIRKKANEALASVPHEFQTDAECADYVLSAAGDSISYSRTTSQGGDDTVSYSVSCGALKVATVTLAQDYNGKVLFSMVPWKLVSENYNFEVGYTPVKVMVPAGGRLEINSKSVDESYISQQNVMYPDSEAYYAQYPTFPYWNEYTVEHLVGNVEFNVYDASGSLCVPDDNGFYISQPLAGDDMYARISGFIDNFLYRYIYFTSALNQDYWGGYVSLQGYLLDGSDLQRRMYNAIDGLTWANSSGFTINSLELHSISRLGNGWYVCDFTSTFNIVEKGTTTNNYKLLIWDNNNDIRAADLDMY